MFCGENLEPGYWRPFSPLPYPAAKKEQALDRLFRNNILLEKDCKIVHRKPVLTLLWSYMFKQLLKQVQGFGEDLPRNHLDNIYHTPYKCFHVYLYIVMNLTFWLYMGHFGGCFPLWIWTNSLWLWCPLPLPACSDIQGRSRAEHIAFMQSQIFWLEHNFDFGHFGQHNVRYQIFVVLLSI